LIVRHLAAGLLILVASIAALVPSALSLGQHEDEADYGWSSWYFGQKAASFDWSPRGTDRFTDPGWDPYGPWSLTQPMGARAVYAFGLAVTGAPIPNSPVSYTSAGSGVQLTRVHIPAATVLVMRITAVLCAALGLALVAVRFGWPGSVGALLFLAIPHVREDLARGWAEGPLLLGLGLCAVAFGRRWLAPAIGLATTFKLTALGLWPLLLWPRATGRLRPLLALPTAWLVWSALTPPSWFSLGPLYLAPMLIQRRLEYAAQAPEVIGLPNHYMLADGVFVASRYLLPLELAVAVALALGAERLWRFFRQGRIRFIPDSSGRPV
jgi:hypothetical protein